MASYSTIVMLSAFNFVFLCMALLAVFHYAYRQKVLLKKMTALRASAEQYQALCHAASDGIFRLEASGRFTLINQAGAVMLGYSSPEALLEAPPDIWDSLVDEEQAQAIWRKIQVQGEVLNRRLDIHRPDGEARVLEMTAHSMLPEEAGQAGAVEGIFRDVTRQAALEKEVRVHAETLERRVEEKTRQVLELEVHRAQLEKLAAMGQMAATIVHEIRNPLSSIKIGLTLLLKQRHIQDRDRHTLNLAVDEVEALERILYDILQFAKPLELHRVRQDISAVAGLALEQMAPELENRRIRVETSLDAQLPSLLLDVDRMGQVIRNLLINAMQAMSEGGALTVRSGLEAATDEVALEVTDTGQGMDQVVQARLFEPFFTTRRQGTGLGMTLVQKIVTAHEGRIHVESEPGRGTTVRLVFPVVKPAH